MARFEEAVPVLHVVDVLRSIEWYARVLGFRAECFPDEAPYEFAILTREGAKLMLRRASHGHVAGPADPSTWSVRLSLSGGALLQLHDQIERQTLVLGGPWRRPYCDVEFEIADPDGHRVCLGEVLPDEVRVPPSPE